MTSIKTTHGEYRGKNIASIVRREYGRAAAVERSADPNSPRYGQIVRASKYDQSANDVLGAVIWVESDDKTDDLSDLAASVRESAEDLAAATESRNEAIRAAVSGGVTMYRVAQIVGLSQQMVAKIVKASL